MLICASYLDFVDFLDFLDIKKSVTCVFVIR